MDETIDLPTVVIQVQDGMLVVMHKKTGMVAKIPLSRLDTWCLRILRAELSN